MMLRIFWLCLPLLLLLLAGCDSRQSLVQDAPLISLRVTDDGGRVITLAKAPQRVATIGAGPEVMLRALGISDGLIPVDFSGGLNVAALDSAKADIALAPLGLFSSDQILSIEIQTGTPVFQVGGDSFDGMFKSLKNIGTLMGATKQANHLADSLQHILARVVDSTKKQATYNTVIVLNTNPLMVAGGTGLLNEMIVKAGGVNLFADQKDAIATVTVDELIARNPEYLIFPTNDNQVYANWMVANPGLSTTPADIQQHIFLVASDYYLQTSPWNIEALLQLTQILHTSLFPQKFVGKP